MTIMNDSKKYNRSDDDTSTSETETTSSEEESDLEENEYERRRSICLRELNNLESQFEWLKGQLYEERMSQITTQLEEVRGEISHEYVNPLRELENDKIAALLAAEKIRDFQFVTNNHIFESENLAAVQNRESEKLILFDLLQSDLREKVRLLEEDRHNIDINSDLWNETQLLKKRKKSDTGHTDRKRKAIHVSGPVLIYNLRDEDIIDDWTIIKKANKMKDKKSKNKDLFDIHYENGKLFYEGEQFTRGDQILIDSKQDNPVRATITAINVSEVWVKRTCTGTKSKLYVSQLEIGKYTIRRSNY